MEQLTFDSEAILAFFFGEEGGETVRDLLEQVQHGQAEGYISLLNLTEIYYILCRLDPKLAEKKQKVLRLFGVKIVPIEDDELWRYAAKIKAAHGMSLADAFAVATAQACKSKLVVGSDKEFNGVDVQFLRIRE